MNIKYNDKLINNISENNLLFRYKKLINIIIIFLFLFSIINVLIVFGDEFEDTLVYVNPSNQIVGGDDNFQVSIYCVPGQPIKSYEFKIIFNSTLLLANSVSEGTIFNGYNTYFNSGVINNTFGTIINVYGLIIGSGNVSSPGSLAVINFTSKNFSGICSLVLSDVGVTNETSYVPISVSNGSIQIDNTSPSFVDYSPSQGFTGDNFVFNVSVSDNIDSADNLSVYVNWSHGSITSNDSMSLVSGSYFSKSVTLDLNSISNLNYVFYANDSFGNYGSTILTSIIVVDNDLPVISNITASPIYQEIYGYVNITAQITDNIGVNSVQLKIYNPNGTNQNISIITNKNNDIYYYNNTYDQVGVYNYSIWVNDQSDNAITSSIYSFFIDDDTPPVISNVIRITSNILDTDPYYGWVNVSCNVTDNSNVSNVYLNITKPNNSSTNSEMSPIGLNTYFYNSSNAFSPFGNYSYFIWAVDDNFNIINSTIYQFSLPPNYDINMDGSINLLDLIAVTNHFGETGEHGWIREDVDNNGAIQVLDLVLISNHYEEIWW